MGLVADADGVAVVALLTPIKERELWIVGEPGSDERDASFSRTVARTMRAYRDALRVGAFNLALWRPPIAPPLGAAEPVAEPEEDWSDLPPIVRIVDRGDPSSRASDIGAMELFAASVVGSDPFDVIAGLRRALA
jgi:hypothetical protein